jgi:hypothetical protein
MVQRSCSLDVFIDSFPEEEFEYHGAGVFARSGMIGKARIKTIQQTIVRTLFPRSAPVKPLLMRESGISEFAPRRPQVEVLLEWFAGWLGR